MAVMTRVVSRRIPGPEVALFRFALGVVAVAIAAAAGRAVMRPRRWGWLFARGLFGGVAVFLYFSCIEHAGVGVATLLNYTGPVWTLLLTWWLLGERPRAQAVAALALTLVGVVCVVGGDLGRGAGGWTLAGVASAFCSGVAITSIRAVRRRGADGAGNESSWTVFASFTGLGLLATLPGVAGPFGRWVTPAPLDWALLIAVGAVSVAAQMLMTDALEHVTGAHMGIITQLTVVFALACGVLLLGERLSWPAIAGSVLTVCGVAWTVVAARANLPP